MNEIRIKNKYDISKAVGIIGKKLSSCEIITDKKISKRVKHANAYFYTGGGYDTETTTIKHDEIIIKGKNYKCDINKKVYYKVIDNNIFETEYSEYDERNIYVKPDFAFVYHVQIMIAGIYITIRDIELVSDFSIELSQLIKNTFSDYAETVTSFPKIIIWVANLQFEWAFLKGVLEKNCITSIFAKHRQPLYITLYDVIELRECIGLFGNSLKKISEDYTTTKKLVGDLDYDKIRLSITPLTDKEKAYCYNDVKILDELSYVAHDMFTKKHLRIPLTETGIVRQEMKQALGSKIYYAYKENYLLMPRPTVNEEDNPEQYKKECEESEKLYFDWRRYLYQGGYSHSNSQYIGKELNGVTCADIVSDYPFQMNTHYYPAGELIHVDDEKKYKDILKGNKFYIAKIRLNKCRAKTSHTLISKNKVLNERVSKTCVWDNGRLYKGDNIILWVNNIDLKDICCMYKASITVLDLYYFTKRKSAPKFLKEVMNKYYITKNRLKQQGKKKTLEYKTNKRYVNCVYGMTGTKIYNTITKIVDNEIEEDSDKDFNYMEKIHKLWLNPYIAYWTTSYARNIIVHYVSSYPDLIVQYDTDSIYFRTDKECNQEELNKLKNEINEYNRKIQNFNIMNYNDKNMWDLGTWEIDPPTTRFKCLGAKRYIYEYVNEGIKEIQPVISGCPKDAFIEYTKEKKIDPFSFFDNMMTLTYAYSRKKAIHYRKDKTPITETITDYLGNTETISYRTFAAIYEVPFTMKVNGDWLSMIKEIAEYDKSYPLRYRKKPELIDILYTK